MHNQSKTTLADLAVARDGTLYALSYDLNGIATPGIGGGIFRISSTGAGEAIITGLSNPTGLTVGNDGAFYVTTQTPGMPSGGQVLRSRQSPEPASWAMLLLGFAAVGGAARLSRGRALPSGNRLTHTTNAPQPGSSTRSR